MSGEIWLSDCDRERVDSLTCAIDNLCEAMAKAHPISKSIEERVSDEKGLSKEHGNDEWVEPKKEPQAELNPLAAYVVAMADRVMKTEDYGTDPDLVEFMVEVMRSPDVLAFLKARDKIEARARAIGEKRYCERCEREFSTAHDLKQHNLGKHGSESPLLTRLLMDMVRELHDRQAVSILSSYLRILQAPEYGGEPSSRFLRDSIGRVLRVLRQRDQADRKSREDWLW
jgi:hypothetical protein